MIRKMSIFVFMVLLILGATSSTMDSEESSFKKNISVVFDDSGSMAFDVRWAHANYALQTLVSLLDEGDLLQIHYMNDSSKDIAWEVTKGEDMNTLLTKIRENSMPDLVGEGETPIDSINIGLDNLFAGAEDLKRENITYDQWLILITDGDEMTDTQGNPIANYVKDETFESGYKWVGLLDRSIASILSSYTSLYNSSYSTVILKIGDASQDMLLTSSMIGSPLIYKSALVNDEHIQEKQIVQNMNDIASFISGRLEILSKEIQEDQLILQTEVPFQTLDILLQDSNSRAIKLIDEQGQDIQMNIEYIPLLSPESKVINGRELISDTNLYGSAIRLTYVGEEALPAGKYSVIFDEPITTSNITSFCFPSIQFIFKYYVNGIEVDKVFQEDRVSIEFIPVRAGTTDVLTNLPENIDFTIDLKCGNQFISFSGEGLFTNEFSIRSDTIEGSLTAQIPDVWLWSLNIMENIDIAPPEEKPIEREFTLLLNQETTQVAYKDFDEALPVIITPNLNGQPLTNEEMEKVELSVVRIFDTEGTLTNLEYEIITIGNSFHFKPKYSGLRSSLPSETYKIEVKLTTQGENAQLEYAFAEFYYEIEDAPIFIRYFKYFLSLLVCIVLLFYGIGIVFRPRFELKKYHIVKSYYDAIIDLDDPIKIEEFPIRVKHLTRYLIPFAREIAKVDNLQFKAGKGANHIYLCKEAQKENMAIDSLILKGELVGQRDLRLNTDQRIEIIAQQKLITYQYVKRYF